MANIYTDSQLRGLLSHPDAFVRSLADWTREYRGMGTRKVERNTTTADQYEYQLGRRLWNLSRAGLTSSPKSNVTR